MLLQLFRASRRFNVEIQPQLVLLQKTLLNVEGLGRQLDPDLDLWVTAMPFLERWMEDQIGFRALERRLLAEAPYIVAALPELPRLLHQRLSAPPAGSDEAIKEFARRSVAQRCLPRWRCCSRRSSRCCWQLSAVRSLRRRCSPTIRRYPHSRKDVRRWRSSRSEV